MQLQRRFVLPLQASKGVLCCQYFPCCSPGWQPDLTLGLAAARLGVSDDFDGVWAASKVESWHLHFVRWRSTSRRLATSASVGALQQIMKCICRLWAGVSIADARTNVKCWFVLIPVCIPRYVWWSLSWLGNCRIERRQGQLIVRRRGFRCYGCSESIS